MKPVTATERVFMWLRDHGVPADMKELYAAFPHIPRANLRVYKKRFIEGRKPQRRPPAEGRDLLPVTATSSPRARPLSPPTSDPPPPPPKLTEEFVEQQLAYAALQSPGDPRVVALLIQWLDKKKALTQTAELEESNAYRKELEEIQHEVFGADSA